MASPQGDTLFLEPSRWPGGILDTSARLQKIMSTPIQHDHACNCGTATHTPHVTGENGCVRRIVKTPIEVPLAGDRWVVEGHEITGFSMREQRGYHQHPCGCWSSHGSSDNSVKA